MGFPYGKDSYVNYKNVKYTIMFSKSLFSHKGIFGNNEESLRIEDFLRTSIFSLRG